MKRGNFILLAIFTIVLCSCTSTDPKQKQDRGVRDTDNGTKTKQGFGHPNMFLLKTQKGELIRDIDKLIEKSQGFGIPDKFLFAYQGKTYLVIINCPFSGRAATFSYIFQEHLSGYILLQSHFHPEGSIAVSVELEHDSLVFKDLVKRPVLVYKLPDHTI